MHQLLHVAAHWSLFVCLFVFLQQFLLLREMCQCHSHIYIYTLQDNTACHHFLVIITWRMHVFVVNVLLSLVPDSLALTLLLAEFVFHIPTFVNNDGWHAQCTLRMHSERVYLKIEFTAVTIERHNIRSHMFYMTWIHLNSVLNDVDRHHSLHAQHYVF